VDKPFSSKLIQTIRGIGYLLKVEPSSNKEADDSAGEAIPKDRQPPS
jgi:DNA-binding winged helix-turn-helix (wHTH) protein